MIWRASIVVTSEMTRLTNTIITSDTRPSIIYQSKRFAQSVTDSAAKRRNEHTAYTVTNSRHRIHTSGNEKQAGDPVENACANGIGNARHPDGNKFS